MGNQPCLTPFGTKYMSYPCLAWLTKSTHRSVQRCSLYSKGDSQMLRLLLKHGSGLVAAGLVAFCHIVCFLTTSCH